MAGDVIRTKDAVPIDGDHLVELLIEHQILVQMVPYELISLDIE